MCLDEDLGLRSHKMTGSHKCSDQTQNQEPRRWLVVLLVISRIQTRGLTDDFWIFRLVTLLAIFEYSGLWRYWRFSGIQNRGLTSNFRVFRLMVLLTISRIQTRDLIGNFQVLRFMTLPVISRLLALLYVQIYWPSFYFKSLFAK